jgi:thioredoxin reductase (NADPH)
MNTTIENLIIIGSGPAGLTAAIYAARAGLKPLVIEGKNPGGQLMGTTHVENWPGETSILGPKLMANMRTHAEHFGTQFLSEEVVDIDVTTKPFTLITHKKTELKAHAIIIATGATPKRLGCPGEDEYWGKGVTTCAVCDGAFYKDRPVVIIGGGDTAMEDASFMTNFTSDITIVHILDKLTACQAMQEKVVSNPAIKIIYSSTVARITGNGEHVSGLEIINKKTGASTTMATDAVFVAVGLNPNTSILKNKLELTAYGYLAVTDHTKTSCEGVFSAGDVADPRYRQAITSAGSGCMAALDAEKYLKKM